LSGQGRSAIKSHDKETPAMRLIDPSHPFFRPKWRRYLVVAAPFAWAGVEWSLGHMIWAYLFAAIGGYLAWHLVVNYRPKDHD
jgi:hypothetical protein